ncbi:MAG: N-acetylmuramoyl-L-alanine amidase [Hyphomicrobiaceae bacterium]
MGRAVWGMFFCLLLLAGPWTGISATDAFANEKAGASETAGPKRTRFVIALEKDAKYQISALTRPNRVVIDLPDIKIGLPPPLAGGPVGIVKSFRGGLAAPGKVKIVIDVTEPVVVEKSALEGGGRHHGPNLVLEIAPVASSRDTSNQVFADARIGNAGLSGVQPPMPHPAPRPGKRQAKMFKPLIVLDPGHGGHDSGAERNGVVEKNAVLAFSLVLRDQLSRTGRYRVLMTRDDDTFVPLDERREIAERHHASLFMAIHADYANPRARGATIYSLRDRRARDLTRETVGKVSRNVLSDSEIKAIRNIKVADTNAVEGFLTDLAKRDVKTTTTRTSLLSRSVLEFMGDATNLMANPDREANFRVLQTVKVPAVLLELAFVTNKRDAANLKSKSWRRKVSASIVEAIDNYFNQQVARLPM